MPLLHVTSTRNRASIHELGLDWTRMAVAAGIAGSTEPEPEGCYLSEHQWEVAWFVRMNNSGGPVDVWRVDEVDATRLVDNGSGFRYLPARIPPEQLTLVRTDLAPDPA